MGVGPVLNYLIVVPYALIVHNLATVQPATPLRSPWVVLLGKCSYSFFLIHAIVISVLVALLRPPARPCLSASQSPWSASLPHGRPRSPCTGSWRYRRNVGS